MKSIKKQQEINERYRSINIDSEINTLSQLDEVHEYYSSAIETEFNRRFSSKVSLGLLDMLLIMSFYIYLEDIMNSYFDAIRRIMRIDILRSIDRNFNLLFDLSDLLPIELDDITIGNMLFNPNVGLTIGEQTNIVKLQTIARIKQILMKGAMSDSSVQSIGLQMRNMLYNKTRYSVSGSAGRINRIYRTELTRTRTLAKLASQNIIENNENVTVIKKWKYTYEAKVPRMHHVASNGQIADEKGYFTILGLRTKGPGLFGLPEEDINCRCDTELIIQPKN